MARADPPPFAHRGEGDCVSYALTTTHHHEDAVSLILKILSSDSPENDSPENGHQVIANVAEAVFIENDPAHPGQVALVEIWIEGKTDSTTHEVRSSAFLMNDQGRTVSRFQRKLPWPRPAEGWADPARDAA